MKVILIAVMCVVPVVGSEDLPWTPAPQKSYFRQAFGGEALARYAIAATVAEITNTPGEWGRGADGMGKRLASAAGKQLIETSVRYSVGALRHEDLRYFPAADREVGGRLRHALASTFVARNSETGEPMMAMGRVSGAFVGGFVSRTWMPARERTLTNGLTTSLLSLGLDAGLNVYREFRPRRKAVRRPDSVPDRRGDGNYSFR